MKRAVVIATLLLGTAAYAVPAGASTVCVQVHVQVNGQTVDKAQCV